MSVGRQASAPGSATFWIRHRNSLGTGSNSAGSAFASTTGASSPYWHVPSRSPNSEEACHLDTHDGVSSVKGRRSRRSLRALAMARPATWRERATDSLSSAHSLVEHLRCANCRGLSGLAGFVMTLAKPPELARPMASSPASASSTLRPQCPLSPPRSVIRPPR